MYFAIAANPGAMIARIKIITKLGGENSPFMKSRQGEYIGETLH